MGTPDFMNSIDRTIYNAFHNTPQIPQHKRNSPISALDMAPTLLECAGAKWDSDQFGLGISLFSERPSLLEQYGAEEFNRLLNENSAFYTTFY